MAHLRLARILREHKGRYGSLSRLQEEIRKANDGRKTVEARKLSAIVNGDPKTLTLSDLEAISKYLMPFGESLADLPLFEADTVLRALVEKGEVGFFLSTREGENRDYASVWDVRAYSKILEAINRRWPMTRVRLCEEPRRFPEPPRQEGQWAELIGASDMAYCCLGAPVFGLAEYMLAGIFGVPAFQPLPTLRQVELPFHFVWYPDPHEESKRARIRSHFALSPADLASGDLRLPDEELPHAIQDRKAQAFLIGKEVHAVRFDQAQWNDYGTIVAQRRQTGETWLVVAGLSGPATCAAAEFLDRMESLAAGDSEVGKASRPVYAVVECAVRENPDTPFRDHREVMDQRIIVGPKVWEG